MADPNILGQLPPEFQAELQKLMRRQQMAQMMQTQAMQGMQQPTQFTGGQYSHPVKTNPLTLALQAFTAYKGGKQIEEADKGIADVGQRYQQATQQELQTLLDSDNPRMYMGSANPRVSQMAAALEKQRGDRATKGAEIVGKDDSAAALNILRSGNLPGEYSNPKLGDPTFGTDPSGNPYALVPEKGGGRKFTYAPKETKVSVDARQAGQEQATALGMLKGGTEEWQKKADAAKEVLQSNSVALDALARGAKAGGFEGFKQTLRSLGQAFGVETEKFTETSELQMALGNAILANARKLAPVTGEDIKRLEAILGSVNTDPTALEKMLTEYNGMATKTLQDANRYFSHNEQTMTDPLAKQVISGAGIGREMIPPPGDTSQMLRALQTLKRQGGDVTQFAVGGEQIPANAQFDIRGPKPPVLPGAAPAAPGVKPRKPIEQMSLQEKLAELEELRKQLGPK